VTNCVEALNSTSLAASSQASDVDFLTALMEMLGRSFLSIGSGDGTQQLACARRGIKSLTVSFFDPEPEVLRKYPQAAEHLRELRSLLGPQALVFGVNARSLTPASISHRRFDQVFFTFPHTGLGGDSALVRESNQALLRDFFRSVDSVLSLSPLAQVTVVLSTSHTYKAWSIQSLADGSALSFVGSRPFSSELYQGYSHRLTVGMGGRLKEVVHADPRVFLFRRSLQPVNRPREP
jgi:hypothetical protein